VFCWFSTLEDYTKISGGKKILYLKIKLNRGDNIKMDTTKRMGGSEVGRVTQGGDQWELLVTEINFRLP